jgi:hypothetical protein
MKHRGTLEGVQNPTSKGKTMLLFEGVAFAVGLLLVVGSTYHLAMEAMRKAKHSH